MNPVIKSTITAVITGFVVTFFSYLFSGGGATDWTLTFVVACLGSVLALVFIIIWGFPVHYLLQKYNKTNLAYYALAGVIPSFYIPIIHCFTDSYIDPVGDTLTLALYGGIVALSFRLSYRAKNT